MFIRACTLIQGNMVNISKSASIQNPSDSLFKNKLHVLSGRITMK